MKIVWVRRGRYERVTWVCVCVFFFFFQAEDGIRGLVRARGRGDGYRRQGLARCGKGAGPLLIGSQAVTAPRGTGEDRLCLLYPSDAAEHLTRVDLGGQHLTFSKTRTVPPTDL